MYGMMWRVTISLMDIVTSIFCGFFNFSLIPGKYLSVGTNNIIMTPINVSLTSIYDNSERLKDTIDSLLNQTMKVDMIYVYLSENPYLLDRGFKKVPEWLTELVDSNKVSVRFVKNTGPYRKLLPLLEEKWNSDEIIITVDDDTVYKPKLVETMVDAY